MLTVLILHFFELGRQFGGQVVNPMRDRGTRDRGLLGRGISSRGFPPHDAFSPRGSHAFPPSGSASQLRGGYTPKGGYPRKPTRKLAERVQASYPGCWCCDNSGHMAHEKHTEAEISAAVA